MRGVIDHLARTRNIVGLKGGRRIGDVDFVVDAEFVTGASANIRYFGSVPAIVAPNHGVRFFEQEIYAPRGRRPQSEQRAVRGQLRTELPCIHAEPAKASTERDGALVSAPEAKSMGTCLLTAVLSTCRQLRYSVIMGILNAISSGAAFKTIKIGA